MTVQLSAFQKAKRTMIDNKNELEGPFSSLLSKTRQNLDEPPNDEELEAYYQGKLSPLERERIQDLLAACPRAAKRLLDLMAYPGDPEDPDYLTDEQLEADWKKLQRHIKSDRKTKR